MPSHALFSSHLVCPLHGLHSSTALPSQRRDLFFCAAAAVDVLVLALDGCARGCSFRSALQPFQKNHSTVSKPFACIDLPRSMTYFQVCRRVLVRIHCRECSRLHRTRWFDSAAAAVPLAHGLIRPPLDPVSFPGIRSLDSGVYHVVTLFAGERPHAAGD